MKIEVNDKEKKFEPVSFTVTCETQKELDIWASLSDACFLKAFLIVNMMIYGKSLKTLGLVEVSFMLMEKVL